MQISAGPCADKGNFLPYYPLCSFEDFGGPSDMERANDPPRRLQNTPWAMVRSKRRRFCGEGMRMLASSRVQEQKNWKKPLAGLRILLAEDESLIALELQQIFADFGCELVGPVASVDEVLENAHREKFDGALLDVNLRGRRIFEILPELQRLGLRIIIASGYDDVTLFPAMFREVPHIAKPFDGRELRRVCEKIFTNPAMP
jgi:CheY-like chemotaxis protein